MRAINDGFPATTTVPITYESTDYYNPVVVGVSNSDSVERLLQFLLVLKRTYCQSVLFFRQRIIRIGPSRKREEISKKIKQQLQTDRCCCCFFLIFGEEGEKRKAASQQRRGRRMTRSSKEIRFNSNRR